MRGNRARGGRWRVSSLVLLLECLPRCDGNVAGFHSFGRGDELGGIEIGEFSDGGWGEVVAVDRPGAVEFFDPRLQGFALLIGQVCVQKRGLVGEAVPVVGDHAAVAEMRLEGSGGGAWFFPATGWIVGGGVGLL